MRRRSPDAQRSYRICDAPGCGEQVPRGRLMCRAHWFALPFQLRSAINQTWRERATNGLRAWSANVLAARGYLAEHRPGELAARITGERE